ncbi:MAG: hypothetical protein ACT6FG_00015 [Methanosarcinaceae archaeon]
MPINIKFFGPFEEDDNDENGAIIYADILDDLCELCSVAVHPQIYQNGHDMKQTGNAELSYRAADSEEFDLILTTPGLPNENRIDFAEKVIENNIELILKVDRESREFNS